MSGERMRKWSEEVLFFSQTNIIYSNFSESVAWNVV